MIPTRRRWVMALVIATAANDHDLFFLQGWMHAEDGSSRWT
jgi:acyl-homoserine lactone acylase PvdQ